MQPNKGKISNTIAQKVPIILKVIATLSKPFNANAHSLLNHLLMLISNHGKDH